MRCGVQLMNVLTHAEQDQTDKKTKHVHMSSVEFHVLCVEVCLDRLHHAEAMPNTVSFLLDFVVHSCTCSQTVFCDRQFSSVDNYCTLFHREHGSFEVLSLHSRWLQWTAVSCKRSICNKIKLNS